MQSYLNKPVVINDPQARLREGDDLMTFVMENNQPKLIPNGAIAQTGAFKAPESPIKRRDDATR
jgi:hypothetical protein